jgi:hypothetical protein
MELIAVMMAEIGRYSGVRWNVLFGLWVDARVDHCDYLIEKFIWRWSDAFVRACTKIDRLHQLADDKTG